MNELSKNELMEVEGGLLLAIALVALIGLVGGYLWGKELAERGA